MAIDIVAVQSRAEQKQFLAFPWKHYAGDPNWIPMLSTQERELLNYKHHPFYDQAKIQTFIAKRDGEVVGRIAAIIDFEHNRVHEEKRGMFGFFETIDDRAVSSALFEAAFGWLRQNGMDCARGPNSPSLNHQFSGCLINAFDMPPTFMMPYNKPYYAEHIEAAGFEKSQDLYAYHAEATMLNVLDPKLKLMADEAKRRFPHLNIRRGNTKNLKADLDAFVRLYNDGLRSMWGFVPLTDSEAAEVAKSLKLLIVPEMTSVVELDGKVIGVCFGMLDYNPIIKKIKGKLFPFGFLHILFGRKQLKKIRLIGTYVAPEYQKWGIGLLLVARMLPDALAMGIEEAEFSYVLETNKLSRGTIERGGAKLQKIYRMYDRQI